MTNNIPATMAAMAQRTLNGFNDRDRATIARNAQDIADAAARYAQRVLEGHPMSGEANRIAQSALQLACLAARLDARAEAATFVDAIADDTGSPDEKEN